MRRLSLFIVLLSAAILFGGSSVVPEQNSTELHSYFGFAINPTANSGLITYAIVEADENNKIRGRRIISRNNWILQMRGEQYSPANPDGKDLWSEHEIGDCFWMLDPKMDKYQALSCEAAINIDDLWRLRYNKNPEYRQDKVTTNSNIVGGWAANAFRPNWPQVQILQKYGIVNIGDFFFGENMFRLLKDVQDKNWVDNYREAK